MVFDGSGPLVKRCDGFDGSLWSSQIPSDLKMVLGRAQQRGPHSVTVHNEGLLHESGSWSDTQGVEKNICDVPFQ